MFSYFFQPQIYQVTDVDCWYKLEKPPLEYTEHTQKKRCRQNNNFLDKLFVEEQCVKENIHFKM